MERKYTKEDVAIVAVLASSAVLSAIVGLPTANKIELDEQVKSMIEDFERNSVKKIVKKFKKGEYCE